MPIPEQQKQLYIQATDFLDGAAAPMAQIAQVVCQISDLLREKNIGAKNRAILKGIAKDDQQIFDDAVADANDQLYRAYQLLDQLTAGMPALESLITNAAALKPLLNLTEPDNEI